MSHGLIFLLILAAVVISVGEKLARKGISRVVPSWPVYSKPLLSAAEKQFYGQLRTALPEYRVLPQVQLARFVEVDNVRNRYEVFNRYSRLSADFVVCDNDYLVLAAVELDDASHERPSQRARDSRKDAVLAAAGVPLLRFRGSGWSVARVRAQVLAAVIRLDQRSHRAEHAAGPHRKPPRIGTCRPKQI